MTSPTKMTIEQFTKSRVKDREVMRRAARHMDELRQRCGKPERGFDSVSVIRKIRAAR